nr:MAG TPA: hypothetical protein [Caudoviricetes sp.]
MLAALGLPHIACADVHTVSFKNGMFGKYSNYPDVRIAEICVHGVGYLVSDNGYMLVAVDKDNRPLICRDPQNEKTKPN